MRPPAAAACSRAGRRARRGRPWPGGGAHCACPAGRPGAAPARAGPLLAQPARLDEADFCARRARLKRIPCTTPAPPARSAPPQWLRWPGGRRCSTQDAPGAAQAAWQSTLPATAPDVQQSVGGTCLEGAQAAPRLAHVKGEVKQSACAVRGPGRAGIVAVGVSLCGAHRAPGLLTHCLLAQQRPLYSVCALLRCALLSSPGRQRTWEGRLVCLSMPHFPSMLTFAGKGAAGATSVHRLQYKMGLFSAGHSLDKCSAMLQIIHMPHRVQCGGPAVPGV